MRPRDLQAEAAEKRELVGELLASAIELDAFARIVDSPDWPPVAALLISQVDRWIVSRAWGPLGRDADVEQGKALRSRELLEYFRGARNEAARRREEAQRLTTLLESAADQGRISRI